MTKQKTSLQIELSSKTVSSEELASKVLFIRGERVMLDSDLAFLYGVKTWRLNEQVKRNIERFPKDFMFQLTKKEYKPLRSQFAISKKGRGGRRYLPYVFTENGVAMLSSVLNSERAIRVNIQIMRMFTKLRRVLATNIELRHKIEELERKFDKQATKYDKQIKIILDTISKILIQEEEESERKIGFRLD